MKKRKLWLISEVFYPDMEIATGNIATEIAIHLARKYDVHVICGPCGYDTRVQDLKNIDLLDLFTIHRVKYFNLDKNNRFKRILRILGISIFMFFKGLKISRNDKVLVISNPALITLIMYALKLIKRIEFILLMHDVFPENLIPAGYIKERNAVYRILLHTFEVCRNASSKIIVIGRDMKLLIEKNFSKNIYIIPNWADTSNVFPMKAFHYDKLDGIDLSNKIVIQFAGNHGILQNLHETLGLIRRVNNSDLHFVFVGGGAIKDLLVNCAKEYRLSNVSFLPPFSRVELNEYQNLCDIGLVCLADNIFGVGVPSKSYNILAAGKPILFFGNLETEIAKLVVENNAGWAFNFSDSENIISFLDNLNLGTLMDIRKKGDNGLALVNRCYKKESILNMLEEAISE